MHRPASPEPPALGAERTIDPRSMDEPGRDCCKYAVLPVWEASERLQKKLKKNSRSEAASSAAYKEDEPDFGAEIQPWYILNPDSSRRVYWDILSLAMITYDIIFVPLEVCFILEETTFLAFLEQLACSKVQIILFFCKDVFDHPITSKDWFSRIFWTLDMGMSCITGFVLSDGVIEYKPRNILHRYFKTWFLPDLSMFSRSPWQERLQSDVVEIFAQIIKMIVVLVMLCHFIACFWWAVGTNGTGTTWVKAGSYEDLSVDASYLVCLLWAISLFSGGNSNIYPETSAERMYGVAAGVCSFVCMAALKTYLRQNHIPKNLTKRLCRSAKHAISGDLTPDSVQLLAVISEPLKMQMHFEMYSRILLHQPFFKDLLTEGNQLVRRVCHQAMSILLLTHSDVVFEVDEEPSEPKMYLVASGSLDYTDSYGEARYRLLINVTSSTFLVFESGGEGRR
eukprot:g17430.t1